MKRSTINKQYFWSITDQAKKEIAVTYTGTSKLYNVEDLSVTCLFFSGLRCVNIGRKFSHCPRHSFHLNQFLQL